MHVGVLAAVVPELPVGIGLVAGETGVGFPVALFEQDPGFVHPAFRFLEPGLQRGGIGEQLESHAGGLIRTVLGLSVANRPVVAAVGGVVMHLAQTAQAVLCGIEIFGFAKLQPGHRVV